MAKYRKRKKPMTKKKLKVMLTVSITLFIVGVVLLVSAVVSSLDVIPQDVDVIPTTTVTTTLATTTTYTTGTTTATTAEKTATTVDAGDHYIQPEGAVWYLKLANDWNPLPEDYDTTFTAVEYGSGLSGKLFDSRAVGALREMLAAGNAADPSLNLQPVSCYRSVARQKTLYWNEVDKWLNKGYSQSEAERVAATVVKRPGQSEHNTGLAVDLGGSGNYMLNQDFENTAAFKWLYENCADYGFILRFPEGKEDITGVIYEPWHYRYVGKEIAQQIMSGGICLEEYLEKTGQ